MTDNLVDKLPALNRVSIRAVLVTEGEDASAVLAQAGFADAVAIPVVVGEGGLPSGFLGDGTTPNLTALLETEAEDAFEVAPATQPGKTSSDPQEEPLSEPRTANLPLAFGIQPLAPVRKFDD